MILQQTSVRVRYCTTLRAHVVWTCYSPLVKIGIVKKIIEHSFYDFKSLCRTAQILIPRPPSHCKAGPPNSSRFLCASRFLVYKPSNRSCCRRNLPSMGG